MSKFSTIVPAIALCALTMVSCDKEDKNEAKYAQQYGHLLTAKYPNSINVDWDKVNDKYVTAEFHCNGEEIEAWFYIVGSEQKWVMSEIEISYATLPEQVKTSFTSGEYSSWMVDDADRLERLDKETLYALEVEQGKTEKILYYNANGELVLVSNDYDNYYNMLP